MILVNGEPQIQQLKLAIISIQQVSSGGAVGACSSHVLAQAVEGCAFLMVFVWVVAICHADVAFERSYPVDLTRLLEGTRQHGSLHHDRSGAA